MDAEPQTKGSTPKELDPVERLNQSIAQQTAQLKQLQSSLAALKAFQQVTDSEDPQDVDMTEVSLSVV